MVNLSQELNDVYEITFEILLNNKILLQHQTLLVFKGRNTKFTVKNVELSDNEYKYKIISDIPFIHQNVNLPTRIKILTYINLVLEYTNYKIYHVLHDNVLIMFFECSQNYNAFYLNYIFSESENIDDTKYSTIEYSINTIFKIIIFDNVSKYKTYFFYYKIKSDQKFQKYKIEQSNFSKFYLLF